MAKYDWEAVEKSYRTGKYSNRQLAKMHGVSESGLRGRIKKDGWSKDLSAPVNQRIKDKLVTGPSDDSVERPSDEEIIEAAATTGASIVFEHRAYAKSSREVVGSLLSKLKEQVEQEYMKVQAFGEVVEVDIPLDYMGKVISAATQSLERIVKIERQAFRLDDDDSDTNPHEALTDAELERQIEQFTSGPTN